MSNETKGNAVMAGQIETVEEGETTTTAIGLLIEFDSPEKIREAMRQGRCEFTVFGGEA